jgi:kynureninase
MPDSDDRTGHLMSLDVDKMQQVTRMVEPVGCIADCQIMVYRI